MRWFINKLIVNAKDVEVMMKIYIFCEVQNFNWASKATREHNPPFFDYALFICYLQECVM